MHNSSARTMLCPNVSLDLPTHLQAGYQARLHSPQLETHSSYQVLGGRAEVSENNWMRLVLRRQVRQFIDTGHRPLSWLTGCLLYQYNTP